MSIRTSVLALLAATAWLQACSPTSLINAASPDNHYRASRNVEYGSEPRQRLDVYAPTGLRADAPVVVFFYGGGWKDGSKSDYEFVASSLTEAGFLVVIPDYRLFPDVTFPSFVDDGADAVAWTLSNASQYGADADRVYLMGHSAGAHIAALLATNHDYLAARGVDGDRLAALIGLSGPYDFLPLQPGYLLDVFPEEQREASQPINFVSAASPPTLLIHGDSDDVVRDENSTNFAAALRENGVAVTLKLYEDVGHARVAVALAPPLDFLADTLEDSIGFIEAVDASDIDADGQAFAFDPEDARRLSARRSVH